MEVARTEGSLVTSLSELRAIEHQRIADERAAVAAAAQARQRELEDAERRARDAEAARLAAERAAQLAAETARADAEREARLRIEAAEAAVRAREMISLEHQRLAAEIALRREVAMRQRPRWMIAITGAAVIAACAMAWLAHEQRAEAVDARAARDHAAAERGQADERAHQAIAERDDLARRLDALAAEVKDAVARGRVAQDDAERRSAQDRLLRLQRQQAALAGEARRKEDERRRRERGQPVVIPAACLDAAVCK